jgi:predicted Zn-ribbon and HTH transcriptional regulator
LSFLQSKKDKTGQLKKRQYGAKLIKLYIGNIGSGKTLVAVKEIIDEKLKTTYSNIEIKSDKNKILTTENLFTNFVYKKDGSLDMSKLKLNIEFWKNINQNINIVIDEAHTLFNSRRSMTKKNILLTDWVALVRKILGTNPNSEGDLILITQLWYRLDNITRDMAHQIKYFTRHNKKFCRGCGSEWVESSDDYEQLRECPECESMDLERKDFVIEVKVFNCIGAFIEYKETGLKTYYKHYALKDLEKYFPYYNTMQWDNLLSDI